MARKWEVVSECDCEETGEPQHWSCKVDSEEYGDYIWITKNNTVYEVEYLPENDDYSDIVILKECKSLSSAKRWATMNIL